ncbi:hypothetical protein ADUPG1_013371 [Aduncisulcus paluster]|uniref:Lipid-binding serum glycoprotein C-terminal domain-containing protein n=1 Tax=Aduncisulcus paluster TaxID=2918883 RepID=A0ABQ5K2P3_9EUKA|nr:hypothetical protein ADUPG1_013371 [Aduncisulcus paluster]
MQISPFNFDVTTPVGKINMSFDNISLDAMDLGDFDVTLNNGILLEFNDAYFRLSLDFSYRLLTFPYTHDGGSMTILAQDAYLQILADFINLDDCQSVYINYAKLDLGEFQISVSDASMLLTTILEAASALIQSTLENIIDSMFAEVVNDFINSMFSARTCRTLDYQTAQDIRLIGDNTVDPQFLSSPFAGRYYGTDSEYYVYPNATQAPDIINNGKFQVIMHIGLPLSFLYTYNYRQAFDLTLDSSNMSKGFLTSFPFQLSTISGFFVELPTALQNLPDTAPFRVSITQLCDQTGEMEPSAIAIYYSVSLVIQGFDEENQVWLSGDDQEITLTADILAMMVPVVKRTGSGDNHVIGSCFEISSYSTTILDSSCEIENETYFSLFLTMMYGDYPMTFVNNLSNNVRWPFSGPAGSDLIDVDIWYGDEYFGMLFDLGWRGDSSGPQLNRNRGYFDVPANDDSICLY